MAAKLSPTRRQILSFALGLSIGCGLTAGVYKLLLHNFGEGRSASQSQGQNEDSPVSDPLSRARSIVKHGLHGPKSENLYRMAYSGCYDRRMRNAHWVAERLTRESMEKLLLEDPSKKPDRRHSTFKEDASIPQDFRVKPVDYINSGYDRGHLVPAADVVESQQAIDETFLMTNTSPQAPAFNRGIWASFERYVRGLVKSFDEVYVVTGPLYLSKADAEDGKFYIKYEVIGRDKNVAVPTHFYKVILGLKNNKPYMGSFVLPNEGVAADTALESFLLPVSVIESSTGLEFFPQVDRRSVGNMCSIVKCNFLLAAKFSLKSGEAVGKGGDAVEE